MARINTVEDEAIPLSADEFAAEIKETVETFAKQMIKFQLLSLEEEKKQTFATWLSLYRRWLSF